MKKAFVTGITGQDGAYLAQILLKANYKVYGGIRPNSLHNFWRLERLGIRDDIELVEFELLNEQSIAKAISSTKPDEFYNLAAQSFVGLSFERALYTAKATGLSVATMLDSIKKFSPDTKFYQASTSEMFGKAVEVPQSEKTPFYPRSPYGVAKLFGHWTTINYRESYDIFASTGILFNHESPLRGEEFVTRKITKGLVEVKNKRLATLELGNIDVKRDWGYAKDYCEGIYKILQHEKPDDFVLATGKTYSIREFLMLVCEALEMKISFEGEGENLIVKDVTTNKTIIKVNPIFYRSNEVDLIIGDPSKAHQVLNWRSKTTLQELVLMMINEES